MTAKEYLLQIQKIHTRIENKKERLERIKSILNFPAVGELKQDKVSTSICLDKQEQLIVEQADLEDELRSLMYEEAALIIKIGRQIDGMDNPTYSRILHLRYEENMQFIDIARMIGQKHKHICNLHGMALNEFNNKHLVEE